MLFYSPVEVLFLKFLKDSKPESGNIFLLSQISDSFKILYSKKGPQFFFLWYYVWRTVCIIVFVHTFNDVFWLVFIYLL